MKRTYFQRFIRFFTITLLLWACNPEQIPLMENADGLYLLSDVENRFAEAINAYDVSL